MEYADLSLYNYLKGLWDFERPKVLAMQAKAQELRCWFDYFALEQDPKDCSPYLAVLLALRAKARPVARCGHVGQFQDPFDARDIGRNSWRLFDGSSGGDARQEWMTSPMPGKERPSTISCSWVAGPSEPLDAFAGDRRPVPD
eukprot:g8678.t1